MSCATTMATRFNGPLSGFIAANTGECKVNDSESKHICVLVQHDKEKAETEILDQLKTELALAFAAPEFVYHPLSAADVIARNRD